MTDLTTDDADPPHVEEELTVKWVAEMPDGAEKSDVMSIDEFASRVEAGLGLNKSNIVDYDLDMTKNIIWDEEGDDG